GISRQHENLYQRATVAPASDESRVNVRDWRLLSVNDAGSARRNDSLETAMNVELAEDLLPIPFQRVLGQHQSECDLAIGYITGRQLQDIHLAMSELPDSHGCRAGRRTTRCLNPGLLRGAGLQQLACIVCCNAIVPGNNDFEQIADFLACIEK